VADPDTGVPKKERGAARTAPRVVKPLDQV